MQNRTKVFLALTIVTPFRLSEAATNLGPFDFAAYATSTACGAITASGNIYTDSYDSSLGSYSQTKQTSGGNLGTGGNVSLSGSVTINGGIYTPHPTEGACRNGAPGITVSGKASATQGYIPLNSLPAFSTPTPAAAGAQNISATSNTSLKPGSYGNVVLSGKATLTLSPGNYVFNSLALSGQTIVTTSAPGPVVIDFAGGNGVSPIAMNGGSIDNPTGVPSNFQLIYAGTSSITLSGGSNSHALVYAPRATVILSGGSDWFGAMVVGALTDSGNVALHYDRSLAAPPTIQGAISPPPNAAGWNDTSVTVSFTCSDAFFPITSCTSPVTVTTQGANQSVTGTAADQEGATATTSVPINIDETPPLVAAAVAPAPNPSGWINSNATVSFSCADALSGVALCPGSLLVTSEGGAQPISGTAFDEAGNSATANISLNLDKTAPIITTAVSPPPNGAGWNNSNVTVTFNCSDSLSGIAACPAPLQITRQGASQLVSGTAIDRAGNTAAASVTVNIDTTAPTITSMLMPQPNGAGWNNSSVTVTFACSDALSGIGSCPAPVNIGTEGAAQQVPGTATNKAGIPASTTAMVSLDETPPALTIVSPANGTIVNPGSLTITGTATDALSGVASVTCSGAPAALIGSRFTCNVPVVAGSNNFIIQAVDQAGNIAQSTLTVQGSGLPVILSVSPSSGQQGQSNLTVTLTGQFTHFAQGTTTVSFGADIVVNSVTAASATSLTARITIPTDATLGSHAVTISTGTEVASLSNGFAVTLLPICTPLSGIVSWWPLDRNGADIVDGNSGTVLSGQFVPAKVGFGFDSSQGIVSIPSAPNLNLSQFTMETWLRVDNTNLPNNMVVVWKGETGGGQDITAPYFIEVGTNSITPPTPNIFGTEGPGKVSINLTDGVHDQAYISNSALPVGTFHHVAATIDGLMVRIYIDGQLDAAYPQMVIPFLTSSTPFEIGGIVNSSPHDYFQGVIDELTLYNRALTGPEIEGIYAAGSAGKCRVSTLLSVIPNTGQPGQQNISVSFTGQSTNWVQGTTQASFSPGITVLSTTVNTPTSASAVINIDPAAALGGYNVTLSTESEIDMLANGFRVAASAPLPTISVISPNSGQQGQQNLVVNVVGQNTHFVQGTTQVSLGSDVTVNSVTVSDAVNLTASLTISLTASLGSHSVTVTSGDEVASLANGFTVSVGSPILLSAVSNLGYQGQRNQLVTFTGQFTHFAQGTTQAAFGPGVLVNSMTVTTPTSAVANITIACDATLGSADIVLTTGSEVVTLSKGFTILAATGDLLVSSSGFG